VDRALDQGSAQALGLLAFVAVIREGIETSLFLTGQVASADAAAGSVMLGAVVGLAVATLLGVGFYQGSRRLNLAAFFRWTGIGLVFIAGGLLAHATHEFIEVGLVPFGTETLFDLSGFLPHDPEAGNLLGQFLRALFGYSATPEVTTFTVWIVYVVVVLALYLRPAPRLPARPNSSVAPAAG
jgi:high-affinity iron transporter